MRDADRAEPHIGVAQHHPLGPPGRARRVEQGGEIVGIAGRRRQRVGMVEQRRAFRLVERRAAGRQVAGLERRQPRGAAEQQAGAAVGEDVGDLHPLEQRVDRDMDQAGARAGERQQAGQPGLGQPARDPVARREPPRLQRRRQRADRLLEPGIIERALARRPAPARPERRSRVRWSSGRGRRDRGVCNFIPA